MSGVRQPRVPFQPLIDALVAQGAVEPNPRPAAIGRAVGLDRLVVHRAIRAGEITVYAADKAAITGLNTHPDLIWGDAWLDQASLHHEGIERATRIDIAFQELREELAR
jgi:hypothetical protein